MVHSDDDRQVVKLADVIFKQSSFLHRKTSQVNSIVSSVLFNFIGQLCVLIYFKYSVFESMTFWILF